jgi:hypothetical protein
VIKVLKRQNRFRTLRALLAMIVMSLGLVVFGPASPASADPVCQQNGAYVLWARGSGQGLWDPNGPNQDLEAKAFHDHVFWALRNQGFSNIEWAELGDLDGNRKVDTNGYPAVPVDNWNSVNVPFGRYSSSVKTGATELINHLNDRYAGDGPTNTGSCSKETLVLGGYSQKLLPI